VEFDSSASMVSLENVTPIVNSLQGLQQLHSTHSGSVTILNPLT